MATTAPDNIRTPDAGDQYALVQDLGAMADTVQNALVKRANQYVGPSAERIAFSSAPLGTRWQDTNGEMLEWVKLSAGWGLDAWHTTVSVPVSNSAGGTTTLTFPAGAFPSTPLVQVSRGSSGTAKYIPYSNGPSSSGVTIGVYSGDGSTGTGTSVVNVTVFRK